MPDPRTSRRAFVGLLAAVRWVRRCRGARPCWRSRAVPQIPACSLPRFEHSLR